ncbi:MAG: nicotinate phosphoribosyltransferase, partial [Methanomicrobiales archaeon]|nr:nicotinate phosphoribosyltransferase [Methanomicrobiales archaeon]
YRDAADGFGVGGAIANAPVIDFSLDIVEIDGRPYAKRGKRSGVKQVYEVAGGRRVTLPLTAPAPEGAESLLSPVLRQGAIVARPNMDDARERVLSWLSGLACEG